MTDKFNDRLGRIRCLGGRDRSDGAGPVFVGSYTGRSALGSITPHPGEQGFRGVRERFL
jgi:hypothetical protein